MKPAGETPSDWEQLASIVIGGKRISKHFLTKKVDHATSKRDLVGDLIITFQISSSEVKMKKKNEKIEVNHGEQEQ